MILENKEYRFSNKLDLSEDLHLEFDFYIDFMGSEQPFVGIAIGDYDNYRGLFYLYEYQDVVSAPLEIRSWPAYVEGLGGWEYYISGEPSTAMLVGDSIRTIILPSTQEVEGGEWILNNLRKPATNPQLINFTIKEWPDQTFQAAVGSTWTMYEPSSYNPGISTLQSGKMAYDG
jgi:hypothetical protein